MALMKFFNTTFRAGVFLFLLAFTPLSQAQLFTSLRSFVNGNLTDGSLPNGVVLNNGLLFGATSQGGASNNGALFSINTTGSNFTFIHEFSGSPQDGASPNDPLVSNGTIFGTTFGGGTNGFGTIFKVATNGTGYAVLRSFTNDPDAQYPVSGVILGGATLYGTTLSGGPNGLGAVFKIDTNGANYSVLHLFTNSPDGALARGRLWLDNATLYGVTSSGGSNSSGTVFKLNTNGSAYSVIYHFTNTPSAATPFAGLTFAGGLLYGVSTAGGVDTFGTIFRLATNGTGFTVLHSFTNSEGLSPQGPLIESNSILYGTTISGGTGSSGTVFQLVTNGANFLVLQNFTNSTIGSNPKGTLAFNGNTLFGIANNGGSGSGGTLFSLLLAPYITLQPQGATITNGDFVTFTSAATGANPLSYQWLFRTNIVIAAATNTTLTFSNANLPGVYSMRVTNNFGAVTSSFALLTVSNQPILLSSAFDKLSGSYSFTFVNVAGSTNRLWATTNLAVTNIWRAIATNVMATNALWFFTDTNIAKTNAYRFYRFSTP